LSDAERAALPRTPPDQRKYPWEVSSIEEAEQYVGFRVARLDPPPPGFIPEKVLGIDYLEGGRSVQQTFRNPTNDAFINIGQNSRKRNDYPAPEGTTRAVTVNGENAVLVTFPAGRPSSQPLRVLHFQWHGHAASLLLNVPPEHMASYPDERLIQIAESLR
jgi:hypothetical protein